MAHPAFAFRGDTQHQRVSRDIAVDHGTGADEGVFTDGVPANDRAIRTQRRTLADDGGPVFALPGNRGTRVVDIGENSAGAAEHIVLQPDGVINGDVVLDLDVVADDDIVADEDVLPERTAFPDLGSSGDMDPVPDAAAVPDFRAVVNDGGWMDGDSHIQ